MREVWLALMVYRRESYLFDVLILTDVESFYESLYESF